MGWQLVQGVSNGNVDSNTAQLFWHNSTSPPPHLHPNLWLPFSIAYLTSHNSLRLFSTGKQGTLQFAQKNNKLRRTLHTCTYTISPFPLPLNFLHAVNNYVHCNISPLIVSKCVRSCSVVVGVGSTNLRMLVMCTIHCYAASDQSHLWFGTPTSFTHLSTCIVFDSFLFRCTINNFVKVIRVDVVV